MISNIYKGNYKLLLIPPIILLLLSFVFIPSIKLGVEFEGGTLITLTLDEKIDAAQLEGALKGEGLTAKVSVFETPYGYKAEIDSPQDEKLIKADELKSKFNEKIIPLTRLLIGLEDGSTSRTDYDAAKSELDSITNEMFTLAGKPAIASSLTDPNQLEKEFYSSYNEVYRNYKDAIEKPIEKHARYKSISIQTVSPSLSTKFIDAAKTVILWSALLSTIFVFIFMRVPIPSLIVVIGAACDVIMALGAMGLFGIPLTLPSFAALLMLVGFSLDTDILLTTRMLKRSGDAREKVWDSLQTGMTMTVSAIVAFIVLFSLASFTRITTYYEISAVALAGLIGDLFATWGINAVLMLWYVEHKGVEQNG